jgi:hypothetical protein
MFIFKIDQDLWRHELMSRIMSSDHFIDMQVVNISRHNTTTKYKNFKMINLSHMVSILNFIFTILFYVTR